MHQLHHDLRIIVHTLEQHRLAAEGDPGPRQAIERGHRCRCQLARMIEVGVHEDRMVLLHHLAELGSDTLRQMRGNATSKSYDFDVRDRAQLLEQVLQTPVAQHHRIAAAHDDVADLRVFAQILERRLVLIEGNLLRISNLPATGAEPAVGCANRAHQE